MMTHFLKFMSGKKGVIASVVGLITAYLASRGMLGDAEVVLIGGLSTVFFGSTSYLTKRMYEYEKLIDE